MKNKHHGLLSVLITMAALVGICGYALSGVWKMSTPAFRNHQVVGPQGSRPTEGQVRRMMNLLDRLPLLAKPTQRAAEPRQLTLFGDRKSTVAGHDGDSLGAGDFQSRRWRLSLTVAAGVQRFCVIDGAFLAEGDHLPDGSQVRSIESQRVMLSFNLENRWIYLNEEESISSNISDAHAAVGRPEGPL